MYPSQTDDVVVSSLSRESRDKVNRCLREQTSLRRARSTCTSGSHHPALWGQCLTWPAPPRAPQIHKALHDVVLPYAMAAFPELDLRCSTVPSDKNLFVVRYVGSGGRPSLSVHKDQVPLTVNIALSAHCNYSGGGTYFPARGGDCNGIVLRPHAGTAIMHDGNVEHAGHKVVDGTRMILVCFFEGHSKDPRSSPACPLSSSSVHIGCAPTVSGGGRSCCHRTPRKVPRAVTLDELLSGARASGELSAGRPGTVSLGMVAPAAFSGFASSIASPFALHGIGSGGATTVTAGGSGGGGTHAHGVHYGQHGGGVGGVQPLQPPSSPSRSVASGVSNFLARFAATGLPALLGQCSLPLSQLGEMSSSHVTCRDLPSLLHRCRLDGLTTLLCKEHHLTLLGCVTLLEDSGKAGFMRYLHRLGVAKLSDRQTLTNALAKLRRDEVLSTSCLKPCDPTDGV